MTSLKKLFGFRDARRSRPRRASRRDLQPERLEPRALLAVTVPPSITTDTVEIDDNVVVSNDGGTITATGGPSTSGHVQIFGNSKGRIDGTPGQSDEDLTIVADNFITVTGGIGGIQRPDDLTLTSDKAQPINLQQVVSLTGDLRVTKAGSFTVGSTVTIDGDLVIDEAAMVTFSGNVTVGGDLTITNATGVTFAGTLTVGGALTITNSTGTTRFVGDVRVGSAAITSTTLVQVQADFTTTGAAGDGDVTFTADQINFTTASLGADPAATGATLVIQPRTTSRALTIASPGGIPAGVDISDADLAAIQPGWKRVVFGDEAAGTGVVRIGSIGSQYGGFSQILNTTTIVGGTVQVVQPVDVTPLAIYLELIARGTGAPGSGAVTIDAPINQTEGERSVWVRLQSAGSIAINAPVWADQIVSLTTTAGGTIAQGGTAAAITAPSLAVDADGAVTLADSGNAFASVAIKTTDDSLVLRDDLGYIISPITTIDDGRDSRPTATVTGIDVGAGTARLVTVSGGTPSRVDQSRAILAAAVGLEGAGTRWNLELVGNDIGTLAANTGSIVFRDIDDLTIGTVGAVTPRSELSGITVERTLRVTAGTTLTITAAGDIISAASSGTVIDLEAPSGISTAGDVITAGGNVDYHHATTLTGDIVLDLEDGPNRGLVTFFDAVDGTTAGQESLMIGGDLDAELSIGAVVALQSLSVSGDSALAGGITLRTTGNQTYSGSATSVGTITIQAGSGSTVSFLGQTTLGGLVTATGDTAAYNVALTGSPVSVTNAVAFANTGTVTLGDANTDSLTFVGGLTSTAATRTNLAGTIATTNKNATFGTTALTADTTVSTGSGAATFTGTVDGGQALVVNAAGDTTFGGMVGFTTPLVSLVTDAAGTTRLNGSIVKTSGAAGMVFNDSVTLGGIADLTAGNQGLITFASTLDGDYSLAARTAGTTTFGGAVGSITPLTLVETDAGGETRIDGGSVQTSGPNGQVYGDAVVLGAATTLTATNSGLVVFVTTLDGGHALAVNTAGLTSFGGAVGGITPLTSLTTDAAGTTKIAGGSVATSGAAGQVYNDAVELQNNTTLTAQASGPITFATTLDGPYSLNADTEGTTTFGGAVGGTMALASITTDAGGTTRIDGGSVKTYAGGQAYGDAVILGANTTLTADSSGMIRFADSIDGGFTLAANTQGETGFDGAVGGTTPLVSLATDAGGTTAISGGAVTTSGGAGQVYNDAVTLGANAILAAGANGPIRFVTTLDGAFSLAANTQGTTTFDGAVGGTANLVSLVTDAGGTTALNGRAVTTSGPAGQVFNDAVTLGADALLTAHDFGAITFASTLNGPHALSADTQGTTTFGGAVGGIAPLAAVVTDAGGTTRINGGSVTTTTPLVLNAVPGDDVHALVSSGQFYNDAVELGANTVLTAGLLTIMPTALIGGDQIAFASTVDGAYSLTVNTVGTTSFNGAVGSGTPLASLATDFGGTTSVTGRLVRTTGSQTYADLLSFEPVVEGDAFDLEVQLAADEDSDVESSIFTPPMTLLAGATVAALQGIAGGGHDLVIEGNAVFGDQPGSLIPDDIADAIDPVASLNDLRITGTTTVNSTLIASTGLQTYESGVVLGSDVLFQGTGQRFESTVTGIGRALRVTASAGGIVFDGDVGTAAAPLGGVSAIAFGGDVRINAAIYSLNPVFVFSVSGSLVGGANNAIRAPGTTINLVGMTGIGVGTPIAVEAAAVNAISTGGDVRLRGIGDLVVGEQGWSANGAIWLDASGEIRVPGGRTIQAPNRVTATKTIAWSITTTADDGAGSLRQVIDNLSQVGDANKSGLDARLVFDVPRVMTVSTPLVFTITRSLPEIRAAVEIIDSNVVLDGTTVAGNGLWLGAAASGSVVRGVTLRNFREYGLQLRSARNVTVDRISVTGLNLVTSMGVYATGNLAGTRVTGSQFTGGLRGMLLDQARGLRVGSTATGQANTFTGNRAVPSRPTFAGTGIRAQGDCTGTIVEGNTFTGNNYGFGFVAARGIALRSNVFVRNTIAGIHVDGNCTGSTQAGNVFATALPDRNRANVVRVRGSRGV